MATIQPKDWKWFGNAGHLIVATDCRFHLCTQVGKYLVPTVGQYWPTRSSREIHAQIHDPAWLAKHRHLKGDSFDAGYMKRFGYETVGCDRLFETRVFHAGPPCSAKDCGCGLPFPADWSEIDFAPYNDAGAATSGHMAMCRKWAEKA